jgi:hypothetical protein
MYFLVQARHGGTTPFWMSESSATLGFATKAAAAPQKSVSLQDYVSGIDI